MISETFITNSENQTIALGTKFAEKLKTGDTLALYGELGSGKTEFIKGICNFLNVEEIVTSPTFTIMNQYKGKLRGKEITVNHVDLYRIKTIKELEEIGFSDFIYFENSIKLIEWAEKAHDFLPDDTITVKISQTPEEEDQRTFEIIYP